MPTPRDNYQRLRSTFDRVVDLDTADRERFFSEKQIDTDIRDEVSRMIDAIRNETDTNDPLESSAYDLFIDARSPEMIGEYKIVDEIGRGGMGRVYLAIRENETFTQTVALKVIRAGMDNAVILRRFAVEQNILARLEHPCIARFVDGGRTSDGKPFYAMEYVKGEPIDLFSRKNAVDLNSRISLFRDACAAVSYAHSLLVVHRDLKPSNILVTADGSVKLLDFGIAKVLEAEPNVETATQFGMMTPQYSSPEQVRGEAVSTASDVYSLGIILYELLCGRRPYETEGKSIADLLDVVSNISIVKPSEYASTSADRSKLKGDLDNIILKALQKDISRRYVSVEQFSEDLRRWQVGLPITARPDLAGYRLKKFISRNRIAVASMVFVLLALLGGIAATTWQAVRAERERVLAQKRFDEVRRLANNVVFKYHDEIAKLDGSTGIRELLVADAAKYLDSLAADSSGDTGLKHELALAYMKLGDAQGLLYHANTGNTGKAKEQYSKSIALLEEIVAAEPENIAVKDDLLRAYDLLTSMMARTHDSAATKLDILDKSRRLLDEMTDAEPDNSKRLSQLTSLYIGYGDAVGSIRDTNGLNQKLISHEKALDLAARLMSASPNDIESWRAFAKANQRVGTDHMWIADNARLLGLNIDIDGHYRAALQFHRAMFDNIQKVNNAAPDDPRARGYELSAISSLALTLSRNDLTAESIKLAERFLLLARTELQKDAANKEARLEIASAYELFAEIYKDKQPKMSAKYRSMSAQACEPILRSDPENLEALAKFTEDLKYLIQYLRSTGKTSEAAKYERRLNEVRPPF